MKLEPFFVASQLVIAGTIMMLQGKDYGFLPEKKTQDLLHILKPQPLSLVEERQNITEAVSKQNVHFQRYQARL